MTKPGAPTDPTQKRQPSKWIKGPEVATAGQGLLRLAPQNKAQRWSGLSALFPSHLQSGHGAAGTALQMNSCKDTWQLSLPLRKASSNHHARMSSASSTSTRAYQRIKPTPASHDLHCKMNWCNWPFSLVCHFWESLKWVGRLHMFKKLFELGFKGYMTQGY